MTQRNILVCTLVIGLSAAAQSMTGTACDSYPDSLLCEDFDSFCNGFNDPCPGGAGTGNHTLLRNAWPKTSMDYYMNPMQTCGQDWQVEENQSLLNTAPFGGRQPNEGDESGSRLPQSSRSLVPQIHANFGEQYDVVLGTDAKPIELYFTISGGLKSASKLQGSNGYMELALEEEERTRPGDLDPEVTPTDYILVGINHPGNPGCISCYNMCPSPNYSVSVPWPTICQSYDARTASALCPNPAGGDPIPCNYPPPYCPETPVNKIHKALAIGALALLDNNPCHCETPANQMPSNAHLSFFDGWKWRSLKSGVGTGGSGDFVLGNKWDEVWLTVKTNTVEITHNNQVWNGTSWSYATSTTTLPRMYLGAFNTLRAGTSSGCKLNNGTYQCAQWAGTRCHPTGGERCDNGTYQADASRYVSFDTVILDGGSATPTPTTGACCLPSASCQDNTNTLDCQPPVGLWQGPGSECVTSACCPRIFGDTNQDGFVDMDDFAVLQRCLTIGPTVPAECACLNSDGGSETIKDIDATDVEHFITCANGPDVPGNSGSPCNGVGW